MKNTIKKYKLKNGKEIELTLTFGKLMKLKNTDKETYEECMQILSEDNIKDMFGYVIILYTAYLCANIDNVKECITYQELIKQIKYDNILIEIVNELIEPKTKDGFRKPFILRTKSMKEKHKIPKFKLEDIEDYYTYYVLILNINEDLFWDCDYSFILSIVANKIAFENYTDYIRYRENKK